MRKGRDLFDYPVVFSFLSKLYNENDFRHSRRNGLFMSHYETSPQF